MKFEFNGNEYYLDGILKLQLDNIVYNIKNDWDFVILITGDRMVRTGKSVLGLTLCAYLAKQLKTKFDMDNVLMQSDKLIELGIKLPKHSILMLDEARESLAASKFIYDTQERMLDYLSECGQLNHVMVVICPDFFELRENVAVARSEFLINVYRKNLKLIRKVYDEPQPVVKFARGYFEFFNRAQKQALYDIAKRTKRKKYNLVKASHIGRFVNQYPVDENLYREKKRDTLKRYQEVKHKKGNKRADWYKAVRDKLVVNLIKDGKKQEEVARIMTEDYGHKITAASVKDIVAKSKKLPGRK